MRYFEKQAINSTPVMRLAVRLKRMYGWSTVESVKMAKGIQKTLKPSLRERIQSLGTMNIKNRVDILQNELKNTTLPIQRIGRYKGSPLVPKRYSG